MLIFVVYGLVEEQPEFFKMLKTVLELLVRPHYHVKRLLVLLLSVDEVLEPRSRILNVTPRTPFALLTNEFVALSII